VTVFVVQSNSIVVPDEQHTGGYQVNAPLTNDPTNPENVVVPGQNFTTEKRLGLHRIQQGRDMNLMLLNGYRQELHLIFQKY